MALLTACFGGGADGFLGLAVLAAIASAALKLAYWRAVDAGPAAATAATATGLGQLGRVRLLDAPTTSQNYVMREMGYRVASKHAARLRRIAGSLGIGQIGRAHV